MSTVLPPGFIRVPNPAQTTGAKPAYYPSLDTTIPRNIRDAILRAFDDLYSLLTAKSTGAGPFSLTGANGVATAGANQKFTLPKPGTVIILRNGVALRRLGTGTQATVNGTAVVISDNLLVGDWLEVYYL